MYLDTLIYDSERLFCSADEKEACLETLKKLARLSGFFRKNGLLAAEDLAWEESDPFLQVCLFEFGEVAGLDDASERFERISRAYLAAGNYRGGEFLNAVLVVKGLLLMLENTDATPYQWGELLSAELRGFFGVEYRKRVMEAIERETKKPNTRKTSLIPEFDRFAELDLAQREKLLLDANVRDLTIALHGTSAAAEKAVLEALTEDARKSLNDSLPYTHNLRVADVTQAQESLLKQWGLVKPDEILKPQIPETDDIIVSI